MSHSRKFLKTTQCFAVCLVLMFSCSASVTAQLEGKNQDVPVRITLKPDKKTIMLGEPLFFAFEVTNLSGEKLCLGVGGDYRNQFGRPDSFKVSVRSDDGTAIPQPEVSGHGGFIGCHPIEPGETYTVKLFLWHWAIIERTGSYRVNVQRRMGFSTYDGDNKNGPKYSMLADVNAEFVVVASEQNRMGGVISSLGSIMLDSSDPRAADAARSLAYIKDKRVISYFAEALGKFRDAEFGFDERNEYSIASQSIFALATYDDDSAIEALQAAMNSRSDDTRESVASAFCDSPHRSAIKLLLKMRNDNYWFVRLRVAQGLAKVKIKESRAVLHKLLKDEHEEVRKAAQESLNKISQVQPAR
ncbi:MAG TPA: HEAT repeat domain-containing protein [Pyrinomonadaceae bacterium]|nr:HEAT repeat domain-containing protein [Pyrinomonadaceae bacterium]